MSREQRRALERKAAKAERRSEAKGTVYLAVEVPAKAPDAHLNRALRVLEVAGLPAVALNNGAILEAAQEITAQLNAAAAQQQIPSHPIQEEQ